MYSYLLGLLLSLPGLVIALSFHEFAHGYAAYKMGDNTARYSGRLSMNPLHHMDPVGTICLLLFRFGWAKPVPINPYNFRDRRKGIIIVSLAGPFANFLLALVCAIIIAFLQKITHAPEIVTFLTLILYYSELLNIGLIVFNLIPIPPLDGSKVLLELLPYRYRDFFYRMERYSQFILILLIVSGVLNPVLSFMQAGIGSLINSLVGLIF